MRWLVSCSTLCLGVGIFDGDLQLMVLPSAHHWKRWRVLQKIQELLGVASLHQS